MLKSSDSIFPFFLFFIQNHNSMADSDVSGMGFRAAADAVVASLAGQTRV
jgi:hypothetical protein